MKTIPPPNRAIIPILNNKSQHPHSILRVQKDGEDMEDTKEDELKADLLCCSWENDQVLEEMRMLAEKEHLVMFDQSHYELDAIPFEGHHEDIREACSRHFRRLSDRLEMMSAATAAALSAKEGDDDESQMSTPDATRKSVVIENIDEMNE